MAKITRLSDDAAIAFDNITDAASHLFEPTLRFGVTGLSRAGKTVFITALVHNLLHGGRLPLFSPHAEQRLKGAALTHQPDDTLPRFAYEDHLQEILDGQWPQSTSSISQLRVKIAYEKASGWKRTFGAGELTLDILDYPGEWLLDLPLLAKSYEQWSQESVALSRLPNRLNIAKPWHEAMAKLPEDAGADEVLARDLARVFTQYLHDGRTDANALSTLPPGRFLMPGDMAGSPALTFAPLDLDHSKGELVALMKRRFEAYKEKIIRPLFKEHFARIDRQIVLVDVLQALNAGGGAVADLENALGEILACFNHGKRGIFSSLFSTRTDRILFAATKADHLHHTDHATLEKALRHMVKRAEEKASFAGARTDVVAMATIRATREATVKQGGEELPVIVGTPQKGELIDGETLDGKTRKAVFPGDLPTDPRQLLKTDQTGGMLQFVRFRPPNLEKTSEGITLSLPHIRLDRAMEFLLGDKLR